LPVVQTVLIDTTGEVRSLTRFTTEDGLAGNTVLGIQEDKMGRVYFDTPKEVSRFDGHSFETLPVVEAEVSVNGWRLEPDDLWFRMGWGGQGPFRYDGRFLVRLTFPKPEQASAFERCYPNASFSPYGIYSIYRDRGGAIWFGTAALGVCRFDGGTIAWLYEDAMTHTPEGGALGIRSSFEDAEGHFWSTHTRHRYEIAPGTAERDGIHYLEVKRLPGTAATNKKGEASYPYFMSMAEDEAGHLRLTVFSMVSPGSVSASSFSLQPSWQYGGHALSRDPSAGTGRSGHSISTALVAQDRA